MLYFFLEEAVLKSCLDCIGSEEKPALESKERLCLLGVMDFLQLFELYSREQSSSYHTLNHILHRLSCIDMQFAECTQS